MHRVLYNEQVQAQGMVALDLQEHSSIGAQCIEIRIASTNE